MKKTILITAILFGIFTNAFSQIPYSSLSFFSEDGYPFTVIMNGLKKNSEARTNVKIDGLTNTNYKVKIIFEDKTIPNIDKNVYTKPAMEVTYRIKKDKKGRNVLRYYSEAPLPYDYVPEEQVYQNDVTDNVIVTDENNTGIHIDMNVNETGGNISIQTDDGGVSLNTNINVNDADVNYDANVYESETHYVVTEENTDHYVMQGYEGRIGCPWPMNRQNFQRAKQTITNADFSDDKQTIAKQIVNSNCLTAQQVKEITGLFDFEKDKLEFAKFAYSHTYDIENYFIINDVFDFSSSIKELNDYINSVR